MKERRPRILYITPCWPHGKAFGGQLRALNIGQALAAVGDVTLAVVTSDAADPQAKERTGTEFRLLEQVFPVVTPNRGIGQKLRWAFDFRYMNLHGLAATATDRQRIASTARESDLVWVLNSRTANILQSWHWPKAHLDVDDVPSTYLRGVSRSHVKAKDRWKNHFLRPLWKRRELLYAQRFTTVSVCSENDRDYLGGHERIHVIPNGFARPPQDPPRALSASSPRIGFIGLYSYTPNLDGVRWFLKECWPAIRQQVPGVRFRLAGQDTDGPLAPDEPDVDRLGWLSDPVAEIATWSAMIIPIRFGGGTRIKIADAFSRKCPVVSTSVGAFGYAVRDGEQLRLADKPVDFARACVELIRDPKQASAMAERAWQEFLQKWTWDAITPRVWSAAEDCLRRAT